MDIRKTVVAAVAALPLFASFAALEVVSPQEGETVEQLWPAEKAFLDMPRESRATYHDAEHTEEWKRLKRCKASAKPVEFKWRGAAGPSTVKVSRLPDGKVFYEGTKTGDSFAITGRLEIARRWKFEVSSAGEEASVTFSTEDRAPRIITLDGVKNARDIGGRIGLDGRRIKQGLVFRTGGLNENANNVYWTYDEIMQLYKEGKLETAGVGTSRSLGPGYAAKIKSGKGLDKNFLRLIKSYPTEAGKARMSAADLAFLNDFVGVKTDIDFRNDRECFRMLVSPLGEHVNWCHYPVWAGYGGFNTPRGRSAMALAFSEFLEARNYPIVFHCIGGADRTGTFAYLLEAFLGVDEEEMVRDYEVTFMGGCGVDKRHYGWFMSLFNAVKALPGDTYPEKLKRYFVSLGFTEEEVEKVREFLLEPRERRTSLPGCSFGTPKPARKASRSSSAPIAAKTPLRDATGRALPRGSVRKGEGGPCFVPALEMTHATPNNGFRGGWFVREVEDADAVGGKAAAVNCDFPKCVLSFRLRNVALDAGEMYSARIRVRGEAAPGAAGEAFAVLASGGRELLSVSAADLSQKWKWHDLGEFAASEDGGFNVYVSRLEKGGEAAVRSLFVDGVEISKTGGGPRCRQAKTVRVADFGYSADDASACVRRAMASDADELVFDAAHSPWIVEPLRFVDVSNKSIRFERGVEVRAKPGAFLARNACLMAFIGGSDVSLVGPGAVFRMERDVYTNAPYAKSEHRHCLTLRGVRNFRVEGLSFVESGGDGILLGGRFVGKRFQTAENVRLDHVVCDRNFRQGLSVISASNLVATCCVFSNTRGTPPQSGVDLEPNQPYEMLSEIVFRDCRFENNAGCGLEFYIGHLNSGSMPVTTLLEGCSLVGNVYGFEYQQNRKIFDDLPAGGAVTLRRCRISGARASGILVVDKPGTSAKLTFDDVVVSDCCRLAKSSDVTVYNRLPDTAPADGFLFRNFAVERGKSRPWLSSACTNATGRVAVDVVGSVTVKTGDRSETVKPMSVWGGNGDSKAKGRYR